MKVTAADSTRITNDEPGADRRRPVSETNSQGLILIVEDSPTQAAELRFILEEHGYTVDAAPNGVMALEILKSRRPILVISDIVMPQMDGYTLCSAVKNDAGLRTIPVLLLTSLSDPKDVIMGLQAGADSFLTKPYEENFLLQRIRYILANRELRNNHASDKGTEILFGGQQYVITSHRTQIIDLLLSTYEEAVYKNNELHRTNVELTETRNQLAKKNGQLEQLNLEKNRFLGMAAHDLRNPLAIILGSSEVIEVTLREQLNDEQQEILKSIARSCTFMLDLINELLDVSIIEAGQLKLDLREADLCEVVQDCIARNRQIANQKQIAIQFQHDELPPMQVDIDKIEQVLNNFITNAIKFSHEGSDVEVRVRRAGDQAVIEVQDHGLGIPQGEMDQLFKPFPQISTRATAGEKSTGLGLAIVRKIAEAHRSQVGARSEVGKGSTFFFKLPVAGL